MIKNYIKKRKSDNIKRSGQLGPKPAGPEPDWAGPDGPARERVLARLRAQSGAPKRGRPGPKRAEPAACAFKTRGSRVGSDG
jgi:hypothetical protein